MGRLRHEAGQTVVLFAILLPLFLGLGAVAVDVGYWYVVKKTAQDAADAAALAAAAELPDKFEAEQAAGTYVRANMPDASWRVEYPYVPDATSPGVGVIAPVEPGTGDPTKVEVVVEHHAGAFFGDLFGLFDVTVSGRAVAERLNSNGNVAIFSFASSCSGSLEFDGSNMRVNGRVHSNGEYLIHTDPDAGGWWAAVGTRVDCGASVNPYGSARFGGDGYFDPSAGTLPDELAQELPWPTWITPAQLGVTWPSGCPDEWTWTTPDSTIPAGVYCAQDAIRIDADNVTGRVTLVAPRIEITGDGQDLAPFAHRVLFFTPPNSTPSVADDGPVAYECDPDPASMDLGGERYTWAGVIFGPCGEVIVDVGERRAGRSHLVGTILAFEVSIAGSDFDMIGRSTFDVIPEVGLAE
jgi:hypothetical protein